MRMQPVTAVVLAMLMTLPLSSVYAKKPENNPSNNKNNQESETSIESESSTESENNTVSELVDLNNQTYITLHPASLSGPVLIQVWVLKLFMTIGVQP